MVSGKKALRMAGLEKEANPEGYSKLDPTRVGVLVGTGMGGLTVFQDGESYIGIFCLVLNDTWCVITFLPGHAAAQMMHLMLIHRNMAGKELYRSPV